MSLPTAQVGQPSDHSCYIKQALITCILHEEQTINLISDVSRGQY